MAARHAGFLEGGIEENGRGGQEMRFFFLLFNGSEIMEASALSTLPQIGGNSGVIFGHFLIVHFFGGKTRVLYLHVQIPSCQKDRTHKLAKSISWQQKNPLKQYTVYVPEPYTSGREIMLYA